MDTLKRLFVKQKRLESLRNHALVELPSAFEEARQSLLSDADTQVFPDIPSGLVSASELYWNDGKPRNIGAYARDQALAFWATGQVDYLHRAETVLRSCAEISIVRDHESFPGSGMLLARSVTPLAFAFDLIRCAPERERSPIGPIENVFRQVIEEILAAARRWEQFDYSGHQKYANHTAAHCMGLAALGCAVDSFKTYRDALCNADRCTSSYDTDLTLRNLILNSILFDDSDKCRRDPPGAPHVRSGEIYDRYRHFTAPNRPKGLQYCHFTLELLSSAAEVAANNNDSTYFQLADPRVEDTPSLERAFEYYADAYIDVYRAEGNGFFEEGGDGEYYSFGTSEENFFKANNSMLLFSPGIFEIALKRYPENRKLKELMQLEPQERGRWKTEILGYPVLTHAKIEF